MVFNYCLLFFQFPGFGEKKYFYPIELKQCEAIFCLDIRSFDSISLLECIEINKHFTGILISGCRKITKNKKNTSKKKQ